MKNNYVLPNIDLLSKENGSDFPLAKITFKKDLKNKLLIPLGIDENKEKCYFDLSSIPFLFVCGTTGSGKSVFLDCAIISLLFKNTPEELNFIFFDTKHIELQDYEFIPHSLYNNASDILKMSNVDYLVDYRKKLLKEYKVKNIEEYNNLDNGSKLNHIIIVIDESVDVMKYEFSEKLINEIIDKGVSLGIHVLLSTNSLVKNAFHKSTINKIPYILSYELTSKAQSDFIEVEGSNLLCEEGEGMIRCRDNSVHKIKTPFVSDEEIKDIINFIKKNNNVIE